MTTIEPPRTEPFPELMRRDVAVGVSSAFADSVDRDARFPAEALAALKRSSALSAYVPASHGGYGVSFRELAGACFELARECAATGMVFAMHQIQVACIVHHGIGVSFFDDYLVGLCANQRLIASATSEVGIGGNLRASRAAATPEADVVVFEKQAPTVSYGAHADDILITMRRSPSAEAGDQVLVLALASEVDLEQTGDWDALGMRGTCSPGFILRGRVTPDHILPTPFGEIATDTMVPFSHVLWGHVWLGIASSAYARARSYVRTQVKEPDSTHPLAVRLAELAVVVQSMRSALAGAVDEYERLLVGSDSSDSTQSIGYAIRLNALKISVSEAAQRTTLSALELCGMAGYRNGSPYSVGRHVRDALSAPLMIANDRLHATNAVLLLVHKGT